MTMRYSYVANHLPENKMRMYPTKVINIIGGPGCGKSLFTAAIILYLNLHHRSVELIPDYAKSLVWQKDYEALRNQYFIAQQQYRMLDMLDGQVQFLVNECSLPQMMFYNEHHADNICDVAKTHQHMQEWYGQFNNVNVLVERVDPKDPAESSYVRTGRFQTEEQAREIDRGLRAMLTREGMAFTALKPVVTEIHAFTASLLKEQAAPARTAD